MDAVAIARNNPGKEVVFSSAGLTTAVAPAASLVVRGDLPDNFFPADLHRLTPPAMELLLGIGDVHITVYCPRACIRDSRLRGLGAVSEGL